MIPILLNHDHTKLIGEWQANGIGSFLPEHRPTLEQLFEIFGGAGVRVLEQVEERDPSTGATTILVARFELVEFSLCPQPVEAAALTGIAPVDSFRDHPYTGPWLPIADAPKDGDEVFVGVDVASVWITRNARWVDAAPAGSGVMGSDPEDIGWWAYVNSVSQEKLEGIYEPTHFYPMPEPPSHCYSCGAAPDKPHNPHCESQL